MEICYSILNPTGNITALVESPVERAQYQTAAAVIMRLHPEVEQVGFLLPIGMDGLPALQMAGGEFCGNATMCAAALLRLRGLSGDRVSLHVSGAAQPLEVCLHQTGDGAFSAELQMPQAREITEREFAFENLRGTLPLVCMEGISHIVIESGSAFFKLLDNRPQAEQAVRSFCAKLGADGLGLLFLEGEGSERRMTPLVYIPGSGTVFWENSCASGSAAAGMYLANTGIASGEFNMLQPGGILTITSNAHTGETRLRGSVHLEASYKVQF